MSLARRDLLAALVTAAAATAARATPRSLRLGICSETFDGRGFAEACSAAAGIGYTGIEVAPFHLSGDPARLPAGRRREARQAMRDAGLEFIGTHALLSAPPGLHLTTPDDSVRKKSWEYFRRLIDLTGDLGDGSVMVLGSGRQRAAVEGAAVAEAVQRLTDGLREAAPAAEARRVTILLEPLAPHLCNVITTLEEAVAVVRAVGSPAVQTMFDTHNTAAETLPPDRLLEQYFGYIRHVHLNEMDGRYPGTGGYDFGLVLGTLKKLAFRGWLSVEVFDFQPDGETVARRSYAFLRQLDKERAI